MQLFPPPPAAPLPPRAPHGSIVARASPRRKSQERSGSGAASKQDALHNQTRQTPLRKRAFFLVRFQSPRNILSFSLLHMPVSWAGTHVVSTCTCSVFFLQACAAAAVAGFGFIHVLVGSGGRLCLAAAAALAGLLRTCGMISASAGLRTRNSRDQEGGIRLGFL
jgi:hypothetical protein